MATVNDVKGKPYAGNLHVLIDERVVPKCGTLLSCVTAYLCLLLTASAEDASWNEIYDSSLPNGAMYLDVGAYL